MLHSHVQDDHGRAQFCSLTVESEQGKPWHELQGFEMLSVYRVLGSPYRSCLLVFLCDGQYHACVPKPRWYSWDI